MKFLLAFTLLAISLIACTPQHHATTVNHAPVIEHAPAIEPDPTAKPATVKHFVYLDEFMNNPICSTRTESECIEYLSLELAYCSQLNYRQCKDADIGINAVKLARGE